jgi:preprotein translocase YajC subunit
MSDASLISAVVIAIVAFIYVTVIRPARKDQATHRQQIRDLRPGDEVLTTANFIARVKDIQVPESGQTRIYLELADGVVFTALPGAILERLAPAAEPGEAKPTRQEGASA